MDPTRSDEQQDQDIMEIIADISAPEMAPETVPPVAPSVDPSVAPPADMVNHPPHYNRHPKAIECIDVVEDNPYPNLANAMRYLWRVSWGGKWDSDEDLNKATWYIQREISRRKNRGIE